jgi:ubiquitin-conjugating enzyme E2 variant
MSLFTVATNQFHKWAHADKTPGWVKRLQRAGLILSPSHHDIHHAMPHDKHYCITAGWMNPLLDKLRFFRAFEALIRRLNPSLLHIDERLAYVAAERERAARSRA